MEFQCKEVFTTAITVNKNVPLVELKSLLTVRTYGLEHHNKTR
jgi:hypothetical protein